MNTPNQPVIMQPGGEKLHAFGNMLSVILGGDQTGGSISVMIEHTPAGGGPPPHVHSREDEIFLVIEGRICYLVDGNWTEVGPGGAVYLPRGRVHCYKNVGSSPSRHWIITIPSGFEKFFARCAEEFARQGGPDMGHIVSIHQEYGIELIDE